MDSIYFENFCDFIEYCSIYFVNLANMNNFKKILDSLLIMLDSTNVIYKILIILNKIETNFEILVFNLKKKL